MSSHQLAGSCMGLARGSVPGDRSEAPISCELQEVDALCMPSRRCSWQKRR